MQKDFNNIKVLRDEYRKKNLKIYKTGKINFHGVLGNDVYNISKEFEWDGKFLIAGRVEVRDSEISKTMFFERIDEDNYQLIEGIEIDLLQDPFVHIYDNQLVIGGTELIIKDNKIVAWYTSFYMGESIDTLKKVASAPMGMKDVRFYQDNDSLHVFTRPQGDIGGKGKIGYVKLNNINDLNDANLNAAPLLKGQFTDVTWGGVNDIVMLKNGLLGAIAHVSYKDERNHLYYFPSVFTYNVKTGEYSDMKILLERDDLVPGPTKYERLQQVIFTGGLVRLENNLAKLYMGVSDCEAHYAIIEDPFIEYEK